MKGGVFVERRVRGVRDQTGDGNNWEEWHTVEKKIEGENGENGRRVISSEQPCGVWSRKLARQQRKLYFTDTMRETPQWESCREHACTTLSSACRIKADSRFRIHPWKEGEGEGGGDLHTHNRKKGAENTVWRDSFDGDIFNMCAHHLKQKKAASLACPRSTYLGLLQEMSPASGWGQGQVGEKCHRCQPLLLFHSVIYILFFVFFLNVLPPVHLSLDATTAVCLKLPRHICIEKLFAYQTAGPQSAHHLPDLQGDARVDMLECMSPLPPSALSRHIPNNHR